MHHFYTSRTKFLVVRSGKLYCDACRHEVSLIKSIIKVHVALKKHLDSKANRAKVAEESKQLLLDGGNYLQKTRPEGTTLPDEVVVFCLKCLKTLLKSGICISAIDHLRPLLEEYGERLTGRQHLADLIPMVLESERKFVKDSIAGKDISIVFDGTTAVREAFALVVRCVDDDFKLHQYLVRLSLAAQSLTGEQVAHLLLHTLATMYQVAPDSILAAMRDRASVNSVAILALQPLYRSMVDGQCFSHTLDHVGGKMETDMLDSFVSSWVMLFSHSPKTKLEWRTRTGIASKSYSKTRWWSKFEVMQQLHDLFGDVVEFLLADVENPGALRQRLRNRFENLEVRAQLQMQLAVVVEFCYPLVRATYVLEGDGPLVFTAYETISSVRNFVNAQPIHLPSTTAMAERLAAGNPVHRQQWMAFAMQCVPDAIEYFNDRFAEGGSLYYLVRAFRAARLCDPSKMATMDPLTVNLDVDDLLEFPFITAAHVQRLKDEVPQYSALCEDLAPTIDPLAWWKAHGADLPAWSATCKKLLLVQPSSAAAERVFSLLQNSFSKSQELALEDYIESSIMLQYNHRK